MGFPDSESLRDTRRDPCVIKFETSKESATRFGGGKVKSEGTNLVLVGVTDLRSFLGSRKRVVNIDLGKEEDERVSVMGRVRGRRGKERKEKKNEPLGSPSEFPADPP